MESGADREKILMKHPRIATYLSKGKYVEGSASWKMFCPKMPGSYVYMGEGQIR
jgi:hypothetical protein